MSTHHQQQNRLQGLPRELRDMIYGYAVTSPTPIPSRINLRDIDIEALPSDNKADTTTSSSTTQVKISPAQPAISQTDRETRTESLELFYGKNTFLFRCHALELRPLQTWLRATAEADYYAPSAALMHHVAIERTVKKTCPQPPARAGEAQHHTYRIAISLDHKTKDLQVRLEADLADECACALQSAAKITPGHSFSVMLAPRSVNAALSFAVDVESDISTGLGGLGSKCRSMFGMCASEADKCEDCGKRISRKERIGSGLLGSYEYIAAKRQEREAE